MYKKYTVPPVMHLVAKNVTIQYCQIVFFRYCNFQYHSDNDKITPVEMSVETKSNFWFGDFNILKNNL